MCERYLLNCIVLEFRICEFFLFSSSSLGCVWELTLLKKMLDSFKKKTMLICYCIIGLCFKDIRDCLYFMVERRMKLYFSVPPLLWVCCQFQKVIKTEVIGEAVVFICLRLAFDYMFKSVKHFLLKIKKSECSLKLHWIHLKQFSFHF